MNIRCFLLLASSGVVSGLDNGVVRLPLMGWNTWCAFGPCGTDVCTEQQVLDTITAVSTNGLQSAGYDYITLDDCFAMRRNATTGELYPDTGLFPEGFTNVVKAAHGAGLKIGIYTSAGDYTCKAKRDNCSGACNVGSLGHYEEDAKTFAGWQLDFVKMDWCSASIAKLSCEKQYGEMSTALNATGRAMAFYMSCGGVGRKQKFASKVANIWRVGNDHLDCWDDICSAKRGYTSRSHGTSEVIQYMAGISKFAGPGGWNTPDFLKTGGEGCADRAPGHLCPGQTDEEYRTEFSLWSITNAPLLVSSDVRKLSPLQKDILLNPEVIAVNQDALAKAGDLVGSYACGGSALSSGQVACQMWAKPLVRGWAVALANFGNASASMSLNASLLGVPAKDSISVRDIWARSDKGVHPAQGYTVQVESHATKMFVITEASDSNLVI